MKNTSVSFVLGAYITYSSLRWDNEWHEVIAAINLSRAKMMKFKKMYFFCE